MHQAVCTLQLGPREVMCWLVSAVLITAQRAGNGYKCFLSAGHQRVIIFIMNMRAAALLRKEGFSWTGVRFFHVDAVLM
jgi:hypothetical protein